MIRNLKTLGLLALAALAVSALTASSALAEVGQKGTITIGETPGTHTAGEIMGVQKENAENPTTNIFTAFGQTVTCASGEYTSEGTEGGTETSLTMQASYSNCRAINAKHELTLFVTVTMEGCDYNFDQPETAADVEPGQYTGTADLKCPEGKSVKVHVFFDKEHKLPACTLSVTPGENTGHIVYTNNPNGDNGKDDVTATATIKEQIPVHEEGLCGTKSETKGSFHSSVTVTSPGNDLWISDPTTTT